MQGRLLRVGLVLALMALALAAWTPRPFLLAGLGLAAMVVLLVLAARGAQKAGRETWLLRDPRPRRLWKAATGGIMLRIGLAMTAVGVVIGTVAFAWQAPGHPGALSVAAGKVVAVYLGLAVMAIGGACAVVSFIAGLVSGLLGERRRAESQAEADDQSPPSAPRERKMH